MNAVTTSSAVVEIVAHRGSSLLAPENTLAAVELAWRERADAVENDFHLTRDGQIVAIHDADTLRVAGEKRIVAEETLTALEALDVGRWKDERFAGERIVALETMLATMPPGKRFFTELKGGLAMAAPFVALLQANPAWRKQVVAISFQTELLSAIQRALPEVTVYLVAECKPKNSGGWRPTVDALIACALAEGFAGLDLNAAGPLDAASVAKIHAAGLKLSVWTVDDPQFAARLVSAGVDSITTNRPGWLRATRPLKTSSRPFVVTAFMRFTRRATA